MDGLSSNCLSKLTQWRSSKLCTQNWPFSPSRSSLARMTLCYLPAVNCPELPARPATCRGPDFGSICRALKILFTFENPLPNTQADAEVFVATARHLAAFASRAWLHVPASDEANRAAAAALAGMPVARARAPLRPAVLRHLCCGLTLPFQQEFREADLVYTRNLWISWIALLFGQRVMFDHYRPWPDQIPPLRPWIRRIFCHRRFLGSISHSEYTRGKYLELQIPAEKLHCVHTGFDPQRLGAHVPSEVVEATDWCSRGYQDGRLYGAHQSQKRAGTGAGGGKAAARPSIHSGRCIRFQHDRNRCERYPKCPDRALAAARNAGTLHFRRRRTVDSAIGEAAR